MGKKNRRSKRNYYKNRNSSTANQKSNEPLSKKSVQNVHNVVTKVPDKSNENINSDGCNLFENNRPQGTENYIQDQNLPINEISVNTEASAHSSIEDPDAVSKSTKLKVSNTNQKDTLPFCCPNINASKSQSNDNSVENESIYSIDNKGSSIEVGSSIVPIIEEKQNGISMKGEENEDKISFNPEAKVIPFSEYVCSEQEQALKTIKSASSSIQTKENRGENKKEFAKVETKEQLENRSSDLTRAISSTEQRRDKSRNTKCIESETELGTDPNSISITSISIKDAPSNLNESNIIPNHSKWSLDSNIDITKVEKESYTSLKDKESKVKICSQSELKSLLASELTASVLEASTKSKSDIKTENRNGLEENLAVSPMQNIEQSVCSTENIESSITFEVDKDGISNVNGNRNDGNTSFDKSLDSVAKKFNALKIEQNEEVDDKNPLIMLVEKGPVDISRSANDLSVQDRSDTKCKNLEQPVINISLLLKDDKSNEIISTSPKKNGHKDQCHYQDNLKKNENSLDELLGQDKFKSSITEANNENISGDTPEHEIKSIEKPTASTSTDNKDIAQSNSAPTTKSTASELPTAGAIDGDHSEVVTLGTEPNSNIAVPQKKHRFCAKWFKNLFTRR